jgi:large subunit ribosomal protein L22
MIEGCATARYVRTSAQKAKLVLDLIRGRDVNLALTTLRFARKKVARDIEKVLRSAVANQQQKEGGGDLDRLYVGGCYANQGPSQKRIRAAPMGRAFRILKRTAHLTVTVCEREEPATPVAVTAPKNEKAQNASGSSKKKVASRRRLVTKRTKAASAARKRKTTAKKAGGTAKKGTTKQES